MADVQESTDDTFPIQITSLKGDPAEIAEVFRIVGFIWIGEAAKTGEATGKGELPDEDRWPGTICISLKGA